MATKKTGISRELVIHPGETIAEVLGERGITQTDLAASTGFSTAFVCNVISGKKDISAKFAYALEYVLGVPKSFWINLQANYDAELLEVNEESTITDEERIVRDDLKEIVRYLRLHEQMSKKENKTESVLSLRRALRVSNLVNVRNMAPEWVFRAGNQSMINPYVLGAWVRICQIAGERGKAVCTFSGDRVQKLTREIKEVMIMQDVDILSELRKIFANYGIVFSVVDYYPGEPVRGYIAPNSDGSYQMVVTMRDAFVDTFWLTLFHELGHIINGDISKNTRFIDVGRDLKQEKAADQFAQELLISQVDYQLFLEEENYSIEAINQFAKSQNVIPYIVIDRLKKERVLAYSQFVDNRMTYPWLRE